MNLKAVILDDEKLAREVIKNYLAGHPDVEVSAECANGFDGIKKINELKPDIIFLDIQMPRINGFEMLELIDDPPVIIFSTAFDQYALKAFEVNAVDYLLKPFSKERFNEALSKAFIHLRDRSEQRRIISDLIRYCENEADYSDKVVVRKGNEAFEVPLEKIKWIDALDEGVMICTDEGKHVKQKSIDYFERRLASGKFTAIDDKFLVSGKEINNFRTGAPDIHSERYSEVKKHQAGNRKYKLKLLTVMFTDIKDYSLRMNLNEISAVDMLRNHNMIVNSIIACYNGTVVETIGDSFFASFDSAVNAAECAVEIQKAFSDYNSGKEEGEKIELRISIHLGDVIEFEEGLKGDVINVAARIQELTEPGSVYISQSVYNTIKSKTHFIFQELGTYSIKNIREPVAIYRIFV